MSDPIADADLVSPTNQEPTATITSVVDANLGDVRITERGEIRSTESGEVIELE